MIHVSLFVLDTIIWSDPSEGASPIEHFAPHTPTADEGSRALLLRDLDIAS
jgi:hypothetical protein